MGTEVSTIPRNASDPWTLLLPPRLAALVAAVGTVQHEGQALRFDISQPVTDHDREQAKLALAVCEHRLSPTCEFEIEGCWVDGTQAKGALLTKMIRGLAGAKIDDLSAAAKVDFYGDAIDDLPAWAVDCALKRMWARGDCPRAIEPEPKYEFPPSPATLRRMAKFYTETVERDRARLQRFLAAVPTARAMDPTPLPRAPSVPALRSM